MRKVTASAVILTALTGCSQSNVPSTQWSFEVPSEGIASDFSNAAPVTEKPLTAGLSDDAQSFIDLADVGRMMGPAFEQPSAEFPIGDEAFAQAVPGDTASNAGVNALAAEAYGISSGLPAQSSTRPDPIAQVRAYLRASGSPSALANRAPYQSDVYLSSLPTPNQYYTPAVPEVAAAVPVDTAASVFTDSLYTPFNNEYATAGSIFGALENDGSEVSNLSATLLPADNFQSDNLQPEAIEQPEVIATELSSEVAIAANSTGVANFNDGLPSLQASLPANNSLPTYEGSYVVSSVDATPAPASDEPVFDSTVSIGTAILQSLQDSEEGNVDSDVTIAEARDTVARDAVIAGTGTASTGNISATPVSSPVGLEYLSSVEANSSALAGEQPEVVSEDLQVEFELVPALASYEQLGDGAYATRSPETYGPETYGPENWSSETHTLAAHSTEDWVPETQSAPTLNSLMETMPARDVSPLIESFRSSDIPPSMSAASVSSLSEVVTENLDVDINTANIKASDVSTEYSPLLEGFTAPAVEPTIYVPIAEEVEPTSNILIQDAIKLPNEEASTVDFLNTLASRSLFSSVLASREFVGDELIITLTNFHPQTEKKVHSKRSRFKAAHRNAAVSIAAKQASSRRQRLSWM